MNSNGSTMFGSGVFLVALLFGLAVLVIWVLAWAKVISKAGYSPLWVLVGFVPVLNALMFLVFAFSEWPVLRRGPQSSAPPWQSPGY